MRRSSLRCAPAWFFGNSGSIAAPCRSSSQNSPAMFQAPEVSSLNHGGFPASMPHWVLNLGPAYHNGYSSVMSYVIIQLRSGQFHDLPMIGIVCFPSYHTVMAILFTFAVRGLTIFWMALPLNVIMLIAIPFAGNHYLADMIGGAIIAVLTIWLNVLLSAVGRDTTQPLSSRR